MEVQKLVTTIPVKGAFFKPNLVSPTPMPSLHLPHECAVGSSQHIGMLHQQLEGTWKTTRSLVDHQGFPRHQTARFSAVYRVKKFLSILTLSLKLRFKAKPSVLSERFPPTAP